MARHIESTSTNLTTGETIRAETTEKTDETTSTKAIVGGSITVAVSFLSSLIVALDNEVVSPVEWLTASVAALVSAGLVFGGVYITTNKVK